ncbi:MAG: AAA family ATPase [Thermoplasmatota archaeon]
MRIVRLELENFRRFREASLEFPDGVIGIVGRNGAGKSTLVEAIGWALFGNEAARTGKDQVRRRGAAKDARCRVRLAFTLDGKTVEIDRSLEGTSLTPTATLAVDGVLVVRGGPNSSKEATDAIERLLHLDRHAFFTSFIARQRELAALLDLSPNGRRELILRMLRVDAVEEAVKRARERKRALRDVVTALEAQAQDEATLRKAVDSARIAEVAARDELAKARTLAETTHAAAEAARARRAEERKRSDRHAELTSQRAQAASARAMRMDEIARRRADLVGCQRAQEELLLLQPVAAEADAARREVEKLSLARERSLAAARTLKRLEQAERDRADLAKALADSQEHAKLVQDDEKALEAMRRTIVTLRETLKESEGKVRDAASEARRLAEEIRTIEGKESSLRRLGPESPCPTCTRPVGEHLPEILGALAGERAAFETRMTDTRAAESQHRTAALRIARELADAEKGERLALGRYQGSRDAATKRDVLLERLMESDEGIRMLRAEVVDVPAFDEASYAAAVAADARCRTAREKVAKLQAETGRKVAIEREIELLTTVVDQLTTNIARFDVVIRELGFSQAVFDGINRAADEAEKTLRTAVVAAERAQSEVDRRVLEARHALEAVEASALLQKTLAHKRDELAILEALAGDRESGALVKFKDHLAGRIRPLLAEHASKLFRELTDGRYAGIELGASYELLVEDDGAAFELSRFSGGEQDLAALCLRLAVGQVVAERAGSDGFRVLVLDEIFGSQDEARKSNVLQTLARLSASFRQILLITHIEDVKERVEHVLRVTDGPEGATAAFET